MAHTIDQKIRYETVKRTMEHLQSEMTKLAEEIERVEARKTEIMRQYMDLQKEEIALAKSV